MINITPKLSLSWTIERQIESDECNDDDDDDNNDDENTSSTEIIEFVPVGSPPGTIIVDFNWGEAYSSAFDVSQYIEDEKKWVAKSPNNSFSSSDKTRKLMIKDWLGFIKRTRKLTVVGTPYTENTLKSTRYGQVESVTWVTLEIATKLTEAIRAGDIASYPNAAADSYSEFKYGIPPWSLGSKTGDNAQWYWAPGWGGGFDLNIIWITTGLPAKPLWSGTEFYSTGTIAISINNLKWKINDVESSLEQKTIERPINYPKMKKECCTDPKLMRMVKEIHESLDPENIKKSEIPKRFLAIDGNGMHKMKNYNEIFEALFLMLDKQGFVPFGVEKEIDDEKIQLSFKHQSQALQAIVGSLIDSDDENDSEQIKQLDRKYSEVSARLALIIAQILSTVIHTDEMCYAILQFLGFRTSDAQDTVPISIDPIGLKEFSKIDKQSEEDPDEFNRKVMSVLFSDGELKVPAIKLNDVKTLQAMLLELKTIIDSKR